MDAEQHVSDSARPRRNGGPLGPRYRFREGIWPVICDQNGWPNNFAASKALGVSDTTISRGLEGVPGERLMAAIMAALPRSWKFEHVFELIDDEAVEDGPPFRTSGSQSLPSRSSERGVSQGAVSANAGSGRTGTRRSA